MPSRDLAEQPVPDRKRLYLLIGGARSGKSHLAEEMATRLAPDGRVLYVATAAAGDDEMRRRVELHRSRRLSAWRTLEEPLRLGSAIREHVADACLVVVDCITVWASNLLLAEAGEDDVPPEIEASALDKVDDLIAAYREGQATFILVSNEVGLGLVPPYPLGRAYRDLLGRVNQRLATAADEVYFLIAGLPIEVKSLSRSPLGDLEEGGE